MEKYPFLRYATLVLRILGWVVLVVGVIVAIYLGVTTHGFMGAIYVILGLILSFLAWLFLLATREFIYIMIHIEENTRNTAESIAKKSD